MNKNIEKLLRLNEPAVFEKGEIVMQFRRCTICSHEYVDGTGGCPACSRIGTMPANVKSQKHYTQFKIQPAAFIAANDLGYFEGNVIKYVCRYKLKNGMEDLKKAQHYLEMLIEKVETGEVKL